MNPARSLAPAIWNANYESLWIYCVAPISAGIITGLIYRNVFYIDDNYANDHDNNDDDDDDGVDNDVKKSLSPNRRNILF